MITGKNYEKTNTKTNTNLMYSGICCRQNYLNKKMRLSLVKVSQLKRRPVLDSILFSLALAVGFTPQLLPGIISINLILGIVILICPVSVELVKHFSYSTPVGNTVFLTRYYSFGSQPQFTRPIDRLGTIGSAQFGKYVTGMFFYGIERHS